MGEEQRSQYCREKGIFPHHLEMWRLSFIESKKVAVTLNKVVFIILLRPILTVIDIIFQLGKSFKRDGLCEFDLLVVKHYDHFFTEKNGVHARF